MADAKILEIIFSVKFKPDFLYGMISGLVEPIIGERPPLRENLGRAPGNWCLYPDFTGSKFNLKLLSVKANACIMKSSHI